MKKLQSDYRLRFQLKTLKMQSKFALNVKWNIEMYLSVVNIM